MPAKELSLKEIQANASCNWCRNPLKNDPANLSEKQFIDTKLKFGDGEKAEAVYCSECIEDEFRKSQPKSAINRKTLGEANIEVLEVLPINSKKAAAAATGAGGAAAAAKEESTTTSTSSSSNSDSDLNERTRASKSKAK
jgi:hypothetical protein